MPGNGSIELFNTEGKKMASQRIRLTRETSLYKILAPMQKGMYLFNIVGQEGKIYTGKAHTGRTNRDEPIEIVYDPQDPENNRSPQELLPLEFSISYVLPVFLIFFMLVAAIYEIVKKYVNSLPIA